MNDWFIDAAKDKVYVVEKASQMKVLVSTSIVFMTTSVVVSTAR